MKSSVAAASIAGAAHALERVGAVDLDLAAARAAAPEPQARHQILLHDAICFTSAVAA